jgi:type IV secretory pathway VirB4 component
VVVDPEGEFGPALDGRSDTVVVTPGGDGGCDPVGTACAPGVTAAEGLWLLTSVATALSGGALSAGDLGLLDAALTRVREVGPATMEGLCAAVGDAARTGLFGASDLAARLAPASCGAIGSLFAANAPLADTPPVVVFDCREVPARARPAVMAAVLGWAWVRARTEEPTLLVIDEAHLLLTDPGAADLLAQFARRARKYGVALDVVTQRLSDFLACEPGKAVLANAASMLLLGCADHERSAAQAMLGLSAAEAALLVPGQPGLGLAVCGERRVPVQVRARPDELAVASCRPR